MNRMEMQEELKEVNNYLIKVQKNRSRIILGVLLGEVLQLRKHVQKLIKESEIDEPIVVSQYLYTRVHGQVLYDQLLSGR